MTWKYNTKYFIPLAPSPFRRSLKGIQHHLFECCAEALQQGGINEKYIKIIKEINTGR